MSRPVRWLALGVLAAAAAAGTARAGDRLEWTGGVSQVEGAAGGGLVPWALIAGLETNDELGATGFVTDVRTGDFSLHSLGVSVGIEDRLELSIARQRFDAGSVVPGLTLGQDIGGIKLRIAGDAVFAPDSPLPQVAVGALWKRTLDFDGVPKALGAAAGADVDLYVAATKLYFAALAGRNVLVDLTLRRTRANQFGLLGFGGDREGYALCPEASAALFLNARWIAGVEYRDKPEDLSVFRERGAQDLFLAWGPLENVTLTLAWTDLGPIAGKNSQRGAYASLWAGF
jgi:hypothetical protein